MTFGSLFSGIGGFDLGFERAGMTGLWACEIDPQARITLGKHFPNMEIYDDVRKIGKRNLRSADVICGGFPCQDLSVAGKRKGLAGERSGLWFEFKRIIGELRPRIVCIENVPGLLSNNEGRDFAVVLSGLVELGYRVCWRVLDSIYFGVAQERRRLFIIGSLGNGSCAEILFESEGVRRPTASGKSERKNAAGNAELLPGVCLGSGRDYSGVLMANAGTKLWLGNQEAFGGNYHICVKGAAIGRQPENGPQYGETKEGRSYTLNCTEVHAVTDGWRVRRFTPRETERLQGFPDDWTADHSDTARYRMTGNAVTVPVAEWIGQRIMESYA